MFQTPLLHLTDQKQAWICEHVHMYPEVPKSSIQCLRTGTYGIITMSLLMEAFNKCEDASEKDRNELEDQFGSGYLRIMTENFFTFP